MRKQFIKYLMSCSVFLTICPALAAQSDFSFGVIPRGNSTDITNFQDALASTDRENLAFVVVNGIKPATEPCEDKSYIHQKKLIETAKNGLIVSLIATDWAKCKNENGKSAAIGRLNRLRDLFFADEYSIGASKIPLIRQSAIAKFRNYGENARWEFGNVMFVTINIPSNNNHYLIEAGRNSEFEDRLVANRAWLKRIFTYAATKKMEGIVLFCDANPLAKPKGNVHRDGFKETRQQLVSLAAKFPGKVLLIHSPNEANESIPSPSPISWNNNIGTVTVQAPWSKLHVDSSSPYLFSFTFETGTTEKQITQ